ncbi:MAG: alpha-glucan family phosphorylase [Spirochaetia bacterium]|nr:alpha-glucan family phosphorylase [Spirochaetia bacterium]
MKFREFNVVPNLPEKLKPLLNLAYNIWWAWDSEAFGLFRDIDPDLWSESGHNPVKLLYNVPQEELNSLASDDGFLFRVESVLKKCEQYMTRPSWFDRIKKDMPKDFSIAYFSAEYGLAECLPIYSGGLGVLSGDHLKSASDLGLPFVAMGLLYGRGYFHQYLNNDGWQQERYVNHDYHIAPITLIKKDGKPLVLSIKMPHAEVKYQMWSVQVGRITLYLMDTNIPENSPADREITAQLYGGDHEIRIKQEYLLGIGGMNALTALGINPTVTHMNEGHAAFLSLERVRMFMQKNNMTFAEAREAAAGSNIFTTHTPVPAGNDRFTFEMIERYCRQFVEQNLKINFHDFFKFGRVNPDDEKEPFCMTVLALRFSDFNNGVSKLHGHVSRDMWKDIWKGVPLDEVPITSITNGVHANSWISKEIADLFSRYLGARWADSPDDNTIWERISEIPDTELWMTHQRRKERLVDFVRRKLKKSLKDRGASRAELDSANEVLSPEILTIGFARRFATYKRGTLIFKELERLSKILTNKNMPVQIIFAGKAHPKDDAGKEFIKQVFQIAQREDLRNNIVFVEDYDLNTAHYLVQGVDVWLNNPIRPLEASGTSGMKVNFNGGLNCSIIDGWWAEKSDDDNGWCIGRGEVYEDGAYRDRVEANMLYDILENDMVPLYYKRGKDDLPHDWIKKMKTSMQTLCPVFNTNRMVMEYTEKFYIPGGRQFYKLSANNFEKSKNISRWKENVVKKWNNVRINDVFASPVEDVKMGEATKITALIEINGLTPDDLLAEVYYGFQRGDQQLTGITTVRMEAKDSRDKNTVYEANVSPSSSGTVNYTIRIMPCHPDMNVKFLPGYIKWAE